MSIQNEIPDQKQEAADFAAAEVAGGPVNPRASRVDDPDVVQQLDHLIEAVGGKLGTFDSRLIRDLLQTALKLIPDGRDTGEIKLITNSVKELRYALRVFGRYKEPHKVTIFGSARTPETHPDYAACVEFSRLMAAAGWMVITGAGLGIMRAGHQGPGRASSFGVAIRLPFETNTNDVIDGDEKLIRFRYFFTRKLIFLSQAEAVALFPGGFGTLDEAFETLTLVQTGKSSPVPIVALEGAGGDYWSTWDRWVKMQLLDRGWISEEDPGLYYMAKDPIDALAYVIKFYRNYHSSRYVGDNLVIRLRHMLKPEDVARLEQEFKSIIKSGGLVMSGALEQEEDNRDLPRLVFHHARGKFGTVHRLIRSINDCDPVELKQ